MSAAAANHVVQVSSHGDSSVLEYVASSIPTPGENQVIVANKAVGLNFIDTYHRSGLYSVPLPYVLGREGAGDVVAVGSGVTSLSVGARVAYVLTPGAYGHYTAVNVSRTALLPENVSYEDGAAVMLQGLTAHYLAHGSYPVKEGETVLVHAAAGGTGLLLAQMAKAAGATVIGTVSTQEKADLASSVGKVDHVVRYTEVDLVEAVAEITGGNGVDAVYDGVGKATFDASMACLKSRGTMVSFGNASGAVPPVNILKSLKGSKYITRPSLGDFLATQDEFDMRVNDVLGRIADGSLVVTIGQRFPLSQAADAHDALESRGTVGKVLLIPDDQ